MPINRKILIEMPIIVLAGGLGTRLSSVVKNRPKILAPIADKLFIDILLEWLSSQGATSVLFSLGVMADQVVNHLHQVNNNSSMILDYCLEPEPLGTLGALAHCLKERNIKECLVINGDTWLDVDLLTFISTQKQKFSTQALVCKKVSDVSRYGHLEFSDDDFIKSFNEKEAGLPVQGWINAGIYYFSVEVIEDIKKHSLGSLETDFLSKRCTSLNYFKVENGAFIDIGTPESFEIAPQILKEYII